MCNLCAHIANVITFPKATTCDTQANSPAYVVQWSNHLGTMCSRAWRSQWPRIDSSLGPGASAY